MALKKQYKIILALIIFIVILALSIVFLIKKETITTKKITNESKKYLISFEKDFKKNGDCNRYNSELGTRMYGMSEVIEGYPVYVVNGCASTLKYYIEQTGDNTVACNAFKEYTQKNIYSDEMVTYYNNYCENFTGKLETNYEGYSCGDAKRTIEAKYIDNLGLANWYDINCTASTGELNIDINATYYTSDSCESLKFNNKFTGVLKSADSRNKCGYDLLYVNGYSTTLDDFMAKESVDLNKKKEYCEYRYNSIKDTNNDYDTFNHYCVNSGIMDSSYEMKYESIIDVKFSAYGASGMECPNISSDKFTVETSGNNECTYHFEESVSGTSVTLAKTQLPKIDNLVQNTTGFKFNGWRRTSETICSSKTEGLTISFPIDVTDISYVPCYEEIEEKTLGYTIYNSCEGNYIGDSNIGQNDVKNTALLRSEITASQDYKTEKSESVTHGNSFNLNSYCTITCKENVSYSYPTIFETVKSGTYFELLSYPEVAAYLTCTENFNYDNWRNTYNDAIKKEKEAYVKKMNSASINNMNFSNNGSCGCKDRMCISYYQSYIATALIYSYNNSNGVVSSSYENFAYCDKTSSPTNTKNRAKITYNVNAGNVSYYSGLYDTAKNNRKALETANETCVNTLTKDIVSTDNYYKVTPKINFYYEDNDATKNTTTILSDINKYFEEALNVSAKDPVDTNVHDYNSDTLYKESIPITFQYGDVSETFNSIKTNNYFLRTVTRNFIFNKSSKLPYYVDLQSGNITTTPSSGKTIGLGYVYPVPLTLSGSRNVYFSIDLDTNLDYGAKKVNEIPSFKNKNFYKCNYDITNDIIVPEESSDRKYFFKTEAEKKKYKKNFYIRSVETSNVDPNDRYGNGLLGANWANDKGQKLIALIEERAKNKNTYNPKYREYSFTLNASTIKAIRNYNKDNPYANFNLECNEFGGECKSNFLQKLMEEDLFGEKLSDVNAYMKRIKDPTWKYYIKDQWYTLKTLDETLNRSDVTLNSIGIKEKCNGLSGKALYECVYRKINEGVLP